MHGHSHFAAWIPQGVSTRNYRDVLVPPAQKKIDLYLFGGIDYDYPMREALLHMYKNEQSLLKSNGLNMHYRSHPGYEYGKEGLSVIVDC